ncbi:MAG: DUF2125 domain-containing protein [Devosiaceae bacterium]
MTNTATNSSFGRKIKWMAAFLIGLVILVSAAWFIAAHFYRQAIDQGREALTNEGVSITCEQETLGGFPARFEWRCDSLQIAFANGARLSGGHLITVAPAWNPLFTIAEWAGPFQTVTSQGLDADIASELMRASIRLNSGLQLTRLSAVLDPFQVTLQGAPQAIASGNQAELHIRQPVEETTDTGDLDVALLVLGFESLLLGGVDQIDLSLSGMVDELGNVQARSMQDAVANWVALSGQITPLETRLRLDNHAINLDGDLTIAPTGLVDFDGTIATNDVPALVELFGIDDQRAATAISAGAALFGQQTTIGEDAATQLPLRVESGELRVGPVSLGRLPPLNF